MSYFYNALVSLTVAFFVALDVGDFYRFFLVTFSHSFLIIAIITIPSCHYERGRQTTCFICGFCSNSYACVFDTFETKSK